MAGTIVRWTDLESARLMKTVSNYSLEFPKCTKTNWNWVKRIGKFERFNTTQMEEKYKSICRDLKKEDESERKRKLQRMAAEFEEKNVRKEMSDENAEVEKLHAVASKINPQTLFHEEFMNYMGYFEDSTIGRDFSVYSRRVQKCLELMKRTDLEDPKQWPTNMNAWEMEHWQALEDIEKLKQEDMESCNNSKDNVVAKNEEKQCI